MPPPISPPRLQPMAPPPSAGPRKGTLAALLGIVAATTLFTQIPREESGRTVDVAITSAGTATVRHLAGKQYLSTYIDIAGVPTACDGITKGIRRGQRFTEAQCTQLLETELLEHAEGIMRCTPALRQPGRENQRAAAVMLGYNIGVGAWCGSTARRLFQSGQWREGCAAFLRWNKAKVRGVLRPVAGLTARRNRERAICLRGL